ATEPETIAKIRDGQLAAKIQGAGFQPQIVQCGIAGCEINRGCGAEVHAQIAVLIDINQAEADADREGAIGKIGPLAFDTQIFRAGVQSSLRILHSEACIAQTYALDFSSDSTDTGLSLNRVGLRSVQSLRKPVIH